MSHSDKCNCDSKQDCGHQPDTGVAAQDQAIQESLALIKNKLLVMSGKGGVGKTSVAVNVAVALSKREPKLG